MNIINNFAAKVQSFGEEVYVKAKSSPVVKVVAISVISGLSVYLCSRLPGLLSSEKSVKVIKLFMSPITSLFNSMTSVAKAGINYVRSVSLLGKVTAVAIPGILAISAFICSSLFKSAGNSDTAVWAALFASFAVAGIAVMSSAVLAGTFATYKLAKAFFG